MFPDSVWCAKQFYLKQNKLYILHIQSAVKKLRARPSLGALLLADPVLVNSDYTVATSRLIDFFHHS